MDDQKKKVKKTPDKQIFVGIDIGTNSVGYAVTDGNYNLKKAYVEAGFQNYLKQDIDSLSKDN